MRRSSVRFRFWAPEHLLDGHEGPRGSVRRRRARACRSPAFESRFGSDVALSARETDPGRGSVVSTRSMRVRPQSDHECHAPAAATAAGAWTKGPGSRPFVLRTLACGPEWRRSRCGDRDGGTSILTWSKVLVMLRCRAGVACGQRVDRPGAAPRRAGERTQESLGGDHCHQLHPPDALLHSWPERAELTNDCACRVVPRSYRSVSRTSEAERNRRITVQLVSEPSVTHGRVTSRP